MEVVLLDEFVKVYAQEFERDEQMLPENVEVQNAYDVVFIVFVTPLEIFEQPELNSSLVLEPLFVSDHLDGHHLLVLVIKALQSLPKAAGAKFVEHFPPVREMVLHDDLVVTSIIVVAEVVSLQSGTFDLLGL